MKKAYLKKHGKLEFTITIPIDARMKKISDEARAKKFAFNEWVRDTLYDRVQDVIRECEIEDLEK